MSKNLKIRLDQLLVNKKLVDTKTKAQSMIMAGQVLVNDKIVTKSGSTFLEECKIIIKKLHPDWVSRGALKLLQAIKIFKINISDKVCLDIGSSTGGFTEVLLSNKAKKIFAFTSKQGTFFNWKRPGPINYGLEKLTLNFIIPFFS